jgi:hypothetical protein
MARQTWNQMLITAETSGAALANSTSATSLLPTPAVFTLPANFFDIGSSLRIKASGLISTTGTPTIMFSSYLAGATWMASQAITTGSGLASVTWSLELNATIRAIGNGTTANAMFTGVVFGIAGANSITMVPATSPTASSGFNSAQANALDLYGTWSAASASNTITLVEYTVESLN